MSKGRERVILLAAGASVVQRLLQLASSAIALPLALYALGVPGFGIWGAATSLSWLAGMLNGGLGAALVSLLPRSIAAGDGAQSRHYVTAALWASAALSLSLTGGALLVFIAGAMAPPTAPFLIAGMALILNIPLGISTEIWFGVQKGYVAAFWQMGQTLLSLLLLVAGALGKAGVSFMVLAIYAPWLLANLGSLLHVLAAHHFLRPHWRPRRHAVGTVLRTGGLLFLSSLAATAASAFDNVMALAWLGGGASAQMTVAMRLCVTANGLLSAVTQPLWPGFTDALVSGDRAWLGRALRLGSLAVLGLGLAGSGVLVAVGAPVLRWWLHQDLHLPPALFWTMGAWIIASTLPQIPGSLLLASLKIRPQILILAATTLAGFFLKYAAARWFGVTGILLVSPLLGFFVITPAFFWLALRTLRH